MSFLLPSWVITKVDTLTHFNLNLFFPIFFIIVQKFVAKYK